ncbi:MULTISPECIES: hypothetical protein [Moorena]|uniref:hypothetical protein n=1 Tax=Moorena TaxID=1155738 RepID=UPI0003155C41|nr:MULTISPECIES: hypothetical protein [Moorena]NEP36537.1 hypothetical protein [Moorena sp. SIO3B2]NEP69799.1 hypothetical protein [Moorena sp. SIO3A5]NEQ04905.1 hypothetical protein [Moorena sp. SIO4E2]NET62978.1 hypothetical protein [Moorena sp. SIO1G6]
MTPFTVEEARHPTWFETQRNANMPVLPTVVVQCSRWVSPLASIESVVNNTVL